MPNDEGGVLQSVDRDVAWIMRYNFSTGETVLCISEKKGGSIDLVDLVSLKLLNCCVTTDLEEDCYLIYVLGSFHM